MKAVSFLTAESLESYIGHACRALEGFATALKAIRPVGGAEGHEQKAIAEKKDSSMVSVSEIR